MTWKLTVFLISLLQLVTSETSAQSDAAGSPIIRLTGDNQTIAYNSNEDVTFNCEVETGNQVVWRVQLLQFDAGSNKTEVFDEYGVIINDIQTNFSQLILTERARQEFSLPKLRVICLPLRFDPPLLNPAVRYITTYGPLAAPRGLTLTAHNSNVFNFSWMKPEVPPGVQLISHIEVLNLTSRDFDVYNSTGEMIDLAFSQFGECSPFNITVFSSDGMTVNSELAFITENIPISPDVSTIKLNTTVDLRNGVSLILGFCPAEICSENYPVLNYTVNVLPNDVTSGTTITMNVTPAATSCDPPFSVILDSTHVPELARDQEHQLSVTACSSITCRTTDSVTTYTTGIQNSTVYYVNRTLLLTCDFALGSNASGCHFNFTLIRNKDGERVVEAFNLTRNSSRVNSTVCGESRTCMCVTTDNLPTTYSSIQAYTLESDKTLSGISVPVALNNSQNNQEIVNECIQLFAQPLVSGGLSGGGIAGIVLSFIIIFILAILGTICLGSLSRKEKDNLKLEKDNLKSENDKLLDDKKKEKKKWDLEREELLGDKEKEKKKWDLEREELLGDKEKEKNKWDLEREELLGNKEKERKKWDLEREELLGDKEKEKKKWDLEREELLGNKEKERKKWDLEREELLGDKEKEKKKWDLEREELLGDYRQPCVAKWCPEEAKSSMVVVFFNSSSSATEDRGKFERRLEAYNLEASPLRADLGKVVYVTDSSVVDELTSLIKQLEQP